MKSEKVYVTRSVLPPLEEYIEEIKPIWDSHWLTNMGDLHGKLESQLKEYLKVQDISLFVNGHMALELAIQAMHLEGEVITTPFTFASTTHAIVRNNLTPVFCDIKEDYTIDADKIEALITEKTSAIVPVHVYGNVCDVEKIEQIAKKYHLKVIYDAAHAVGVEYKGQGVGAFGDASMFSFHATKVFNTIEGGAVTFHDATLSKELYSLKNFGIRDEELIDGIGANGKMNEFQAAMGICNLRHLEETIESRKRVWCHYHNRLKTVPGIKVLDEQKDVKGNYAYFPIEIMENYPLTRDEVSDMLREHNIFARKYFYPLISAFECYKEKYSAEDTPRAKMASYRILTLPLYPDIDMEVVDRICDLLQKHGKGV